MKRGILKKFWMAAFAPVFVMAMWLFRPKEVLALWLIYFHTGRQEAWVVYYGVGALAVLGFVTAWRWVLV